MEPDSLKSRKCNILVEENQNLNIDFNIYKTK